MLQRLGRYELSEVLGQGGMATVYRGYDPLMGREVAVKVLIPILAHDAVFRSRFESEIRAISQLEHPAIVPIYDAGEEEGHLYLVMRLMEDNLRDRLRQRGVLSYAEALHILRRVASALYAAHQAGIIHRDVKPSNVLFDRYGVAYLTDFGIARLASMSETLTGSQLMGTPAYMSPEQIEGRKDIDHRADIYALGILLFHMLAGRPPFQGDSPSRVMFQHLTEPPPDLREFRPDAPEALQRALAKALAKQPEERYNSALEFVRAVEEALQSLVPEALSQEVAPLPYESSSDEMTLTSPALPRTPELPWWRRLPLWTWPLLFILIAVVIGFSWASRIAPTAGLNPISSPQASPSPLAPAVLRQPTVTPSPVPSPTLTTAPQPTSTPEGFLASGPYRFGADRVAVLWQRDIWTLTTDGQDLRRHTQDGSPKKGLRWLSSTQLLFLSKNCAYVLVLPENRVETLLCVENYPIDAFDLSPDGQWAALVVQGVLYLFPFTEFRSREPLVVEELQEQEGVCVPKTEPVSAVRWGQKDRQGERQLLVRLDVPWPIGEGRTRQGHRVERFSFVDCQEDIQRLRFFPLDPRNVPGFLELPFVADMAWNSVTAVFISPLVARPDWGHLYGNFNVQVKRLNPVEGLCCYRLPTEAPIRQAVFLIFGERGRGPYRIGAWELLSWDQPRLGWVELPWEGQVPLEEIEDWAWRPAP